MESLKQESKETMIRLLDTELSSYEFVDMYCEYPDVEEGISWHLVLKNKECGECVTVTAGTCMGRPSPQNDLELDYNQHDVEWGQGGLWDDYDCFELSEIEDPDLAGFLHDWTYDVRKHIADYATGNYTENNRNWAEQFVGHTIVSAKAKHFNVEFTLDNDEILTVERNGHTGG